MEEIKIMTSPNEWEKFMESTVWADMVAELNGWLEGFDGELDGVVATADDKNPSTANVLMHMGSVYGRKQAVAYMLSLPSVLSDIAKEQKSEKASNQQPEEE